MKNYSLLYLFIGAAAGGSLWLLTILVFLGMLIGTISIPYQYDDYFLIALPIIHVAAITIIGLRWIPKTYLYSFYAGAIVVYLHYIYYLFINPGFHIGRFF